MKKWMILAITLLICSCNPLRKTQRNHSLESHIYDRSEIQRIVNEAVLEQVNLRQTITEYYPPQLPDPVLDTELLPSAHNPSAHPRSDGPAVKRVIYTEITTQTETQTTCDSIAKRNVLQGEKSELAEKVVEKPPSSVMAVKWIAIGIGLLALLIIVIKIRIK